MKKTISAETRQSDFTTNCQSNLSYLRALGKSQVVNGQLLNVRGTIKQTMSNGGSAHVDLKGVGDVKDIYADKSFNIWDEQWEVGRYNNINGGKEAGDGTRIRNKNPIPVFPNTTYYKPSTTSNVYYYDAKNQFIDYESNKTTFTTPINCYYICFFTAPGYGITYNNDICINESNTYFNGLYVPHSAENYIIHRVSEYEFTGNEDWEASGDNAYRTTVISSIAKAPTDDSVPANIISEINVGSSNGVYDGSVDGIALPISKNVLVSNNIYNNRATMLAGKHIVFELATPTIEYIDATTFKQRNGSNSIVYQNTILPVEYQEVEYIESHGTEYINTGYKPNQDSKVVLRSQLLSIEQGSSIFGSRLSNNVDSFIIGISGDTYMRFYAQFDSGSRVHNYLSGDTEIHIFELDKNYFVIDGIVRSTISDVVDFDSSYNCFLFGALEGESRTLSAQRVYYCKIYNNASLIRNFIPCYRKSDGEVGLFDLVNGVFYTNQGTGAFTKGPCVDVPVEYQRVEYIESTGTQYIDTGLLLGQAPILEIVCASISNVSSLIAAGVGDNVGTTNIAFCQIRVESGVRYRITSWGTFAGNIVSDVPYKVKTSLLSGNQSQYLDDVLVANGTEVYSYPTDYKICLFKRGSGDTSNSIGRIYSAKLFTENNLIVCDFIPCYRLSDNVIGLFDLINGVFYTNSGSGTFLKGSDVFCLPTMQIQYFYNSLTMNNKPIISIKDATSLKQITSLIKNNKLIYEKVQQLPETYQAVGYLESTGTQYIDTGFVPVQNIKIELDYKSTKQVGEAFQCIFGAQRSSSEGRCYMLAGTTGNLQFNYPRSSEVYAQLNEDGTVSYESTVYGTYVFPNSRIKWTYNNANKSISNGVLTWVCSAFTEPFVSPSCNLYLLTRNNEGTADEHFGTGYLYGFKIWAGENLVRNFVPCYRKSDSKPGLYDLVNDVFYTNQGTGEFNIGPIVTASGELPLTLANTIGGVKLLDYSVQGAARVNGTPLPTDPSEPTFAGEKIGTGGTEGLALTFTVTDANGNTDTKTIDYPSVEPLRSASGVSDEINFSSGKIIRRIGIDRNPVLRLGNSGSYGTGYPAVSWRVGGGTTIPSYPHILSSHWCERKKYYVLNGYAVGLEAHNGSVYTNMPRANYRKYVNGATGNTEVDYNSNSLVSSVSPGTYRCDFYDDTSTIFTLDSEMNGCDGFRDVVAVSRTKVTLIHRMEKTILNEDTEFEVEEDYEGTGESLFLLAKEDYDAEPEPLSSICSHFEYADMFPEDMIDEYTDPAYCDDDDYWYFFLPGVSTLEDFIAYLTEQESEGAPVTLCYSIVDVEETDLDFTNIPTSQASSVTTLPAINDNRAFDNEANYTLLPAMQDFCADEAAAGRPVTFYYVLPQNSVTQTDIALPALTAGEGSTTLTVTASSEDGIAPETGSITALCEV